MTAVRKIDHQELRDLAVDIFTGLGTPIAIALEVSDSLVEGSLAGMDSHGILQIIRYAEKIRRNTLMPDALPRVENGSKSSATVYGNYGFGQVTAHRGIDVLASLASEYGVASVVLREVNHIGRLGEYAERLAEQGLISMIMASGGDRGGQVAAYGGRDRIFGTNPIAWGIPTPANQANIIVDFATSAIATGKVLMARKTSELLPPGALITKEGLPTTDPDEYFDSGASMLPFGGHKGYALMLVIEIMANIFGGNAPLTSKDQVIGNPVVMTAWDVDQFSDRGRYYALVGELCDNIRGSSPAKGFEKVLLPGQLEAECRERRLREGIPVPEAIWKELQTLKHDRTG
jgi:LDH2 family malate/lactate/ureidoglycolate dehydrogenase